MRDEHIFRLSWNIFIMFIVKTWWVKKRTIIVNEANEIGVRWFINSINMVYQQIIYKYVMQWLSQSKKFNISKPILSYIIVFFFIKFRCVWISMKKDRNHHEIIKKLKNVKKYQIFLFKSMFCCQPLFISYGEKMNKFKSHRKKLPLHFDLHLFNNNYVTRWAVTPSSVSQWSDKFLKHFNVSLLAVGYAVG